jgi:hypothetical protein
MNHLTYAHKLTAGKGWTICTVILTLLLFAMGLVIGPAQPAQANRALPDDMSYSTETMWILPGLPDLSATSGYIPHNFSHGEAIFQIGDETIHGFRPGKVYPEMYVRDIAWGMETAQYYYPDEYLRDPIEAYLRRQYTANTRSLDGDFGVVAGAGAIGGIITPDGRSNKQTATTDEETSLIHAAYLYYNMAYDTAWLQKEINGQPIIERLNLAADWLYAKRLDPGTLLLWRGHTTDWGDVKFEPGPGYTDYNPAQDHLTASIFDQALAYMALIELAKMNAAAGNTTRADEWQQKAENLKNQTNTVLWQAGKGFYLTHAHVTPLNHDFDESAMVSISNALAVYAGLTDFRQNKAIFDSLEWASQQVDAKKPGLSLYPYYPNQWPNLFFEYPGMGYGHYQNGGIWDWWGAIQIKSEFLMGFAELGQHHLLQVANEWKKHPGNIIEWQSSTGSAHEGSHYYSAAAGTMGSAIIDGFFGARLEGRGFTVQPRLGLNDGFIRIYQPATDRYGAYSYDWDQNVSTIQYGTNAPGDVAVKVLKLRSEHIRQVTVDGRSVEFDTQTIGNDTYTVVLAPSGQHTVEIFKGQPLVQAAAVEASSETASQSSEADVAPVPTPTQSTMFAPEPKPALAANRPEAAPPSDQVKLAEAAQVEPAPLSPQAIAARNARENQQALLRLLAVGVMVLMAMFLFVLWVLRKIGGLAFEPVPSKSPQQQRRQSQRRNPKP